ncbi:MAG TPA: hypothetical protein VGN32_10745 [Ktedonobacterales bacterium]|jgi:uncharacterized membrane protein YeaQ/YmgE (transglycosylase-associated protein family)|nr:hypothetical protein [Ktedonobacterales bacterium]
MTFAGVAPINIIPDTGILDTIFHKTWLAINVFGVPSACTPTNSKGCGGYAITLIGLIIIIIIAAAATAIAERLTGAKPGGLLAGILITLFGAFLFSVYVNLPFEIILESVHLIAAFLGAVVVAVFYVLLRNQVKGTKKG